MGRSLNICAITISGLGKNLIFGQDYLGKSHQYRELRAEGYSRQHLSPPSDLQVHLTISFVPLLCFVDSPYVPGIELARRLFGSQISFAYLGLRPPCHGDPAAASPLGRWQRCLPEFGGDHPLRRRQGLKPPCCGDAVAASPLGRR